MDGTPAGEASSADYSKRLFAQQYRGPTDELLRKSGWSVRHAPATGIGEWTLAPERGTERTLWSRGRPFAVAADGSAIRVTKDGALTSVDLATGAERRLAAFRVNNAARAEYHLSPDARFMVFDVGDGSVLCDTASWEPVRRWPKGLPLTWIRGPGGAFLAWCTQHPEQSRAYRFHLLEPRTLREIELATPVWLESLSSTGIAPTTSGGFLVALIDGSVAELAKDGSFVRTVFSAR